MVRLAVSALKSPGNMCPQSYQPKLMIHLPHARDQAGDYIVAIDKKLVDEMTLNEAVDKMRGAKGTKVLLTSSAKTRKHP